MNLFIKSYNFYLFFFFFIVLETPSLTGKNTILDIPTYSEIVQYEIPVEYNKSPNLSFCRSHLGVTFIGKDYGLLVIDEEKIFVSFSDSPVKAANGHNHRIAYIAKNDFGYLEYDPFNGIQFSSLTQNIAAEHLNFESGDIAYNKEATFFATSQGVFFDSNDSLHFLDFNRNLCRLFMGGENIYLHVESMGIFHWNANSFELAIPSEKLQGQRINQIVDHKEGLIVLSENTLTYFHFTEQKISSKPLPAPFSGIEIKNVWFLDEESMLCMNHENHLLIYDSKYPNLQALNGFTSLPSTDLNTVFKDQFNDIWLVYDFNIFKTGYPGKYLFLDLSNTISGTILSSDTMNENLYLGTNEGLFCIKSSSSRNWQAENMQNNLNDYIHQLTSYGNVLLGAGNRGLFEIKRGNLILIDQGNFEFVKLLNDTCFVAEKDNILKLYSKTKGRWTALNHEIAINQVIDHAKIDGKLYLLTQKNILLTVSPTGFETTEINCVSRFEKTNLLNFNDNLLIRCNNVFYTYNPKSKILTEDKNLPVYHYLEKSDFLKKSGGQLWSAEKEYDGSYTIRDLHNETLQSAFFKISADELLGQIIDIVPFDDYIWIVGNRKLVRLKSEPDTQILNKTLRFQSVTDLHQRRVENQQRLKYKNNHVIFSLGNIRFYKEPYPYYRYKLTHYQEKWSEWKPDKIFEFNHLRERNYSFTVQSLSHTGQISEPVSFAFTIAPPFYRTWYAYVIYFLFTIICGFLIYKWRLLNLKKVEYNLEEKISQRMKSVLAEKEKSDKLVEDLLPKATAEELKSSGRAKSKKFELATVLFSDIEGFTRIAEEMNPEVLIDELDKFFFHFDSVVEKYNIEKIKTIGDAYMAAGGIPIKNSSNPVEVVLAGLEMQSYMRDLKNEKADIWDLRIGIHTGPVITGVVGHKKLSYDIWGDTVNTASRMESSGEGGKVNISGVTYSIVKDYFICEYRGKLPVKYKGNIDMYFVKGLRPELSVDLQGIPNKRFFTKLQILRLKDLEEVVYERLYKSTSLQFHFHNKEHVTRLFNQIELLGRSENISEEDLLITQTAALLLYTGLTENYENFENHSINFAREILPQYWYSEKQTNRVCNLILATKMPFKPQNLFEKIMIDSKMEYLGRSDYLNQVKILFREMKEIQHEISREKIIRSQIQLQKDFRYYTIAAQRLREIPPEKQIELLKSWK